MTISSLTGNIQYTKNAEIVESYSLFDSMIALLFFFVHLCMKFLPLWIQASSAFFLFFGADVVLDVFAFLIFVFFFSAVPFWVLFETFAFLFRALFPGFFSAALFLPFFYGGTPLRPSSSSFLFFHSSSEAKRIFHNLECTLAPKVHLFPSRWSWP